VTSTAVGVLYYGDVSGPRALRLIFLRRAWWGLALAGAVLLLSLALLACEDEEATEEVPSTPGLVITTVTPSPTPEPTPTPVETPEVTATATPVANICSVNPDPAGPDLMVLEEPRDDDAVTSPVHVRGWGAGIGFEGSGAQVVVYDSLGAQLAEVNAPPLSTEGRTPPDTLEPTEFNAPFGVDVDFATNFAQPGCIWVFEISARDGSPIHVVQIPVLLEP
jgi:hypothetical protein